MAPQVQCLGSQHDRESFTCGVPEIDTYLKKRARQDYKRSISTPYFLSLDDGAIVGFYTLSSLSIKSDCFPPNISKKLPRYNEMPATLIGRLAVDMKFQQQGYGSVLLMDALCRTWQHAKVIASLVAIVDAKNDQAKQFYKAYGFEEFPDQKNRLFLPMEQIKKLFA